MNRIAFAPLVGLGTCALLALGVLSIVMGAMQLPVSGVLHTLLNVEGGEPLTDVQWIVLTELRLPRTLMAFVVGALLAQCGVIMQGLFRNPLAEPGIVGVSSGAALGAVTAIVLLPAAWATWAIPAASFVAGLLCTWMVYRFAQSPFGTSVLLLLLSGIAVSAFSGAVIGFLTYYTNDQQLRALSLWQMGTFNASEMKQVALVAGIAVPICLMFYNKSSALDALLLGEAEARYLGVQVERLKKQMVVLCALGVGISVAFTGIIGFVGLVVPHLVRMMVGPSHQQVLPLSALLGGLLLMAADLSSRLLVQPAELPVGILTAMLGGPFFFVLLFKQRKAWQP